MGYMWIDYREIADWLRRDPDRYWTVDGDPVLGSMLNFPATGGELADAVESLAVDLLVFEHVPHSSDLDDCVETEELGTRVLKLRWANGSEWILIEDPETTDAVG